MDEQNKTVTGFTVEIERKALRLLGRAEGDFSAARALATGPEWLDVSACLDALQARSETV